MTEENTKIKHISAKNGLLSEFNINQHSKYITLATSPVILASTVVLVNDIKNMVWINGTVNWQVSLSGSGEVSVLFEILRDNTVIYTTVQSISAKMTVVGTKVINHAHLQHIDTKPISKDELTPVVYHLRARVISPSSIGTVQTLTQAFSTAEIMND